MKIKTYNVQLGYSSMVQMEVKAISEYDAIYKARKIRSELYDSDFQRWQESIIEGIEPWEEVDTAEEEVE
jgi:hypothetical protein